MPSDQTPESQEPIQIKRYANRKLYHLSARRYITLDGVARLVEEGHDIRVIDNQTGQDVTVLALSQIIVEQAKSRPDSLSERLLSGLIRARGDIADAVGKMANMPLELLALATARDERLATREDVNRLTRQVDKLLAQLDALEKTGNTKG